jgi:hypothetical protein
VLLLADIAAIALGLALGWWAGFAIGSRWASRRAVMWLLTGVAMLAALAVDVAGRLGGQAAISFGSLGLMAGLLTGIKYGGFPETRLWDRRVPTDSGRDDAPR